MDYNAKVLKVNTEKPYSVVTMDGGIEKVGEAVKTVCGLSKVMIVTDTNVEKLYLNIVEKSLRDSGYEVYKYIMTAGEKSKNTNTFLDIIYKLEDEQFIREDLVLALGGGVVGDVAGFVAATYMRGINYVQVPTTVLAAIDSSIGGKTAVNLNKGKNLLGAFHQPKLVLCDCSLFKTLPERELRNGFGEGIKYAVLLGGESMQMLKNSKGNMKALLGFVVLCQQAKITIVEKDERENGARRLLNLGHTFGHAIEKLTNYEIPHGIAVAQGLCIMAEACYYNDLLSEDDLQLILSLCKKYWLKSTKTFTIDEMFDAIKLDKKATKDGKINIVKIRAIGDCYVEKCSFSELRGFMNKHPENKKKLK